MSFHVDIPQQCPVVLRKLLQQYPTINGAAKANGLDPATLYQLARGERNLTDFMRERIMVALENPGKPEAVAAVRGRPMNDVSKAPKLVQKLIAKGGGTLKGAGTIANMSSAVVGGLVSGARKLDKDMKDRIEQALAGETPPPLEKGTGAAARKDFPPDAPQLILDLIAKHGGNRTAASRALGYSSIAWLTSIGMGHRPFDEAAQARVQAALNGEPPPVKYKYNAADNTGMLGIVIVLAKADKFEALYDAGTAMGGTWVLKRQLAGGQWLAIMRAEPDRMNIFTAIARPLASDVIMP